MSRTFKIFIVGFAILVFLTSSCSMKPIDPPGSFPLPPGSEQYVPTLKKKQLEPTLPRVKIPKVKIPKPIKPPKAIKVK